MLDIFWDPDIGPPPLEKESEFSVIAKEQPALAASILRSNMDFRLNFERKIKCFKLYWSSLFLLFARMNIIMYRHYNT